MGNTEDLGSLIQPTTERRTSTSSTTSNSSEISITTKIKNIESMEESLNKKSSKHPHNIAKNQKTRKSAEESPIKSDNVKSKKKEGHKVLSKKKGLKSLNLKKSKMVDNHGKMDKTVSKVNEVVKKKQLSKKDDFTLDKTDVETENTGSSL